MNYSKLLSLATCLLAIVARADLTIVQEVTSNSAGMGGGTQEMTVMVAQGKTRIEHSQGGMIMIPSENKNIVLMHSQKMYMNMPQLGSMMGAAMQEQGQSGAGMPHDQLKWEKTGQKDTIAGYPAEQWSGKDATGKTVVEVWVGGKPGMISEYIDNLSTGGNPMAKMVEQLKSGMSSGPYKEGFPLKSVMYDENGAVQTTTLVKKLDSAGVDGKWFDIPAGYQEMKMPSMPQGQAGMQSMPDSGE
jgi:hypothetical protein